MKYCSNCGAEIADQAVVCPKCGCAVSLSPTGVSQKSWLVAVLLCLFLGGLGIHRFYLGRTASGILMLLTLGGLGIWTIIDFFIILFGSFRDGDGLKVKNS